MENNEKIGNEIRDIRKSKGLTLERLADNRVSTSTLSNIERGLSSYMIEYYLQKLDKSPDQLKSIAIRNDEQANQIIQQQLTVFESSIDQNLLDRIDERVEQIKNQIGKANIHYPTINYLRGKKEFKANNYDQAKTHLTQAIQDTNKYTPKNPTNTKAASYNELSVIAYHENNLKDSIRCAEQGINSFHQDGERKELKWTLFCNLALYYEKIGDLNKAQEALRTLFVNRRYIYRATTRAKMHMIQARIFKHNKNYPKAIEHLTEGIDDARQDNLVETLIVLYTIYGAIFRELNSLDDAETCLSSALTLIARVPPHQLENLEANSYIETHIETALLHIELKRWDAVQEHIKKAWELAKKCDNGMRKVDILVSTGIFYQHRELYPEATMNLERAKKLARQYNLNNHIFDILGKLSDAYKLNDEIEKSNNALQERYELENRLKRGDFMLLGDRPGES